MMEIRKKREFTSILTVVLCVLAMSFCVSKSYGQEKFVVVLDAGHGGKDPGKAAKKYYEKDIALSVVLKLGKKLEALDDVKVVYTRVTDVFLDLKEREDVLRMMPMLTCFCLFIVMHSIPRLMVRRLMC